MNLQRDLRDSLHREMLASGRGWSSEEIARTALKIVSDPLRADRLISAILGNDPRFRRRGSTWQAGVVRRDPLGRTPILLVEAARGPGDSDVGPIYLCPYEPASLHLPPIVRVMPDGDGLDRAAVLLEGRLSVSLTAHATRRALHRLEQTHALPASAERLLDLRALGAFRGGDGTGGPVGDTGVGEDGDSEEGREQLEECRSVLERFIERCGTMSLEEVEEELERSRLAKEVDFSRFRFSREEIARIPARPGVYRFIDETARLLYVGKSRDLGRRVGSYFRPLGAGHARRARLLTEMRDLEWETTPSELEALILEGESIRRDRPRFNQQIEIHAAGETVAAREANLAFVLCEGDPEEVSVFFLRDGRGWGRARLSRVPGGATTASAKAMAEVWLGGEPDAASGCVLLDDVAGVLVVRYLRHHRDRIDRLHADEFASPDEAGEGLARLAVRDRPAWEPWVLRP